jgi:hypothetical protein
LFLSNKINKKYGANYILLEHDIEKIKDIFTEYNGAEFYGYKVLCLYRKFQGI